MTELRSPFVKLTPEEAQAELNQRRLVEEALKKEIPELLAVRLKPAEEKRYLIMVYSDGDNDGLFIDVIGRTDAYKECKDLAINGITDLERSFIIVEGTTLEKSISVLSFLRHMQYIFNDGFNVEDYWSNNDNVVVLIPTAVPESAQVSALYDPNAEKNSIDV